MSQDRKPGIVREAILTSAFPNNLPKLPPDVLARFPSLVQWQNDFTRMWESMRQSTERDRRELQNAIDGVAARIP